ncbi:MAG: hypothetical protein H6744_08855 [Deltaproteobacteria bacterium]|nr:hypothetical protein [Deltaproteobacteria bacterium]MCB9786788.1 hypothetical protein [Deltaproteobacteria bacterium]
MKRFKRSLVFALVVVTAPVAWAADETKSAETPAQALEKVQADKRKAVVLGGFEGGLFEVDSPEDDLVEPVPMGTREDFERRGYEIVDEGKVEMIVDPAGQIYVDRRYQGVIPGIRSSVDPRRDKRMSSSDIVLWAGFQPMTAVSRVFWVMSNAAPRFEVTRLGPTQIEVFFPGARVLHRNEIRPMYTSHFPTPVDLIDGFRVRGGVRYIIKLKRPANYLYRFEAPFLYLDFETDAS